MSVRSTVILFILAVISVLALWYVGPVDGPAARRAAMPHATMLVTSEAFPVEHVDRITLTRRDEPTMVFKRAATGWMQHEPFPCRMDRSQMRRLIDAARSVEVLDRVELDSRESQGLSLSAVSLDPPEATIRYEWSRDALTPSPQSATFHLGRRGIGGRAYLRLDDEPTVLVVTQELHEIAVDGEARGWRDRTLFREVGVDSDRIERSVGDEMLVLERHRRTWRMLQPVRTRVDREMRDMFLQSLGGARAESFLVDQPRDLSRFGLEPPVAWLRVVTRRLEIDPDDLDAPPHEIEDVQRLLIGSPAGAGTQDRFAMMEGIPTVVRLPAGILQHLFMPAPNLIEPTGSGVLAADVKAIVVRGPEGTFRLERDLDRWLAPEHDDREVFSEVANGLLAQLTESRATSITMHEYPHELEVATVTLHGFDGRPMDTVRIIRDPDTGRWGLENGDMVFRIFPSETSVPLTPDRFGLDG